MVNQKERFELGPFINDLWNQYRAPAAAGNITCRVKISQGISIFTDKSLIRAILENLFSNAVDYTHPGGVIEWETGLKSDTDNFFITVSNTVTDLTSEDLPHLFERFWRKDAARTSDGIHSGLGLSTARAIAEALGLIIIVRMDLPDRLRITLSGETG